MVAATTIRVRGLDALERRLASLPPKIERKVLRGALRKTGNKVKKKLKAGTPRRTGFAARKVRLQVKVNTSQGAFAKVSYRGRTAGIMGMRERGTVRQPARPFFERATAGWERETEHDFQEALKQVVEKVG